jgi:hypothetical protein
MRLSIVALAFSGCVGIQAAQAIVVPTVSKQGTDYAVRSADLLQTSFGSVTAVNLEANGAEPILRNGTFDVGTGANERATAGAGRFVEYALDTTLIPGGYTITNINTTGYWPDAGSGGRSSQEYKVSVSFVGSPTTFVELVPNTDWTAGVLPTAGLRTEVKLANGTGGALSNGVTTAQNVARVRFDFGDGDPLGVNMYRELDVIGFASALSTPGTVIVPNGSFELPNLANGPGNAGEFFTTEVIAGWSTFGAFNEGVQDPSAGRYNQNATTGAIIDPGQQADGDQFAFVNTSNSNAGITSAVVALTEKGTTYDLTVALGKGIDTAGLAGTYQIAFLVDGLPVGTPVLVDAAAISAGDFVDFKNTFIADSSGGALQLQLSFTGTGQAHFDNVRLTAIAVPEPAVMSLLSLGGLALLRRNRRMA